MKNEKQTVGEHFQEVRKEKNISIDEIVRDTNIPKRYLESIEADNFDVFPGETYAMGFITNYADALEVDRETALNLYRRQMKIEQDSPIEQLVGKKREFTVSNNMIVGIAIALGALLIIVLVLFIMTQTKDNSSTVSAPLPPRTFTFSFDNISKIPAQHFRVGDSVNVTNATKAILVTFVSSSPSRSLTLRINQNEYTIKTGELFTIDSDSNGTNDLGIEIFSAKEKDIRLAISPLKDNSNSLLSSQDDLYNRYKEFILSESIMMQTNAKGPVMVRLSASGTGWVHYIIDNRDEKEAVMNAGASIAIPFNDNMTLYLGNGGAFKVGVSGKEEDGGGWGEVGKSIFYWKNKDNKFQLVRAVLK